jgi:hypothetical protein
MAVGYEISRFRPGLEARAGIVGGILKGGVALGVVAVGLGALFGFDRVSNFAGRELGELFRAGLPGVPNNLPEMLGNVTRGVMWVGFAVALLLWALRSRAAVITQSSGRGTYAN